MDEKLWQKMLSGLVFPLFVEVTKDFGKTWLHISDLIFVIFALLTGRVGTCIKSARKDMDKWVLCEGGVVFQIFLHSYT